MIYSKECHGMRPFAGLPGLQEFTKFICVAKFSVPCQLWTGCSSEHLDRLSSNKERVGDRHMHVGAVREQITYSSVA